MSVPREQPPAAVPSAKQAGEPSARWAWCEPAVWTERMLTALEVGVKGGVWFSLIDKVYAPANLAAAARKATAKQKSGGVDHVTTRHYRRDLENHLSRLHRELREQTYRPRPLRRKWIDKPGRREKRPLDIPTVEDRVVQTAIRHVLEPIFERDFAEQSYGFRPGRGCHTALEQVETLLAQGNRYVVEVDLQSYFNTIPHEGLMNLVRSKVSDGRLLALLEAFLNQGVLESMNGWQPAEGCPQGSGISPLLSNIYLDPLDHLLAERGFQMVRYADDFVVLCRTREAAETALAVVKEWVEQAGLALHPEKTGVADAVTEGFEFLGYRFINNTCVPRKKSIMRLKEALRQKSHRKQKGSLTWIIGRINPTLRGWLGYFRRSNATPFPKLDGWLRMRLRSILRKRQKKRGRGRGRDHQRWTNNYFKQHGLYELKAAHALYRQSSSR